MSGRGGALITGAGVRIGRALALAAAEAGYAVAVHHNRSKGAAEAIAATICSTRGVWASAIQADLAEPSDVAGVIARATDAVGPLTLLVNNASIFEADEGASFTREGFARTLDINLYAPLALAQAFANALPPDREGLIVNLLDQRVLRPSPGFFSYGISKAALWWATRTLAQALAPRIRVVGLAPGPTLPNARQSEAEFATEAAATLTGRRATPEELGAALRYLIDAPSVTGQLIAVDGGQHLASDPA